MNRQTPVSILLVEDDTATREILTDILTLKFQGLAIHCAENGQVAVDSFREYQSAIVITDINMPVMDGLSMAKEIKAMNSAVKLIALTAFSDKTVRKNQASAAIDYYIPKPTDYRKLFSSIERCLAEISSGGVLARHSDKACNEQLPPQDNEKNCGIVTDDSKAFPESKASGMRVLVVDDNLDMRQSTAWLLETYGYNVQMAESAETAMKLLHSFQPEAVLLDIGLPGENGYQLASRIRSLPGGEQLMLVAVSGFSSDEDIRRSRQEGFDHHLVKPFIFATLHELLSASKSQT